jgi:hypothetical protein
MLDQGIFEFRFGVFIFEIEEFEDERVFDGLFRRNRIARLCLSAFSSIAALLRDKAIRS